jgi:hypothetical protein
VQGNALSQIAFYKSDVVLCMMEFRFEVDQINHKKLLKEKGQKESCPEAGCRGEAKRKRNKWCLAE